MKYVCVLFKIYYLVVLHIGRSCCVYFLIYFFTVSILIDLRPQYLINTSFFKFAI